jgi:hypothetical protein
MNETVYRIVQVTEEQQVIPVVLVDQRINWSGTKIVTTIPLCCQNIGEAEQICRKLNKGLRGLGFVYEYRKQKNTIETGKDAPDTNFKVVIEECDRDIDLKVIDVRSGKTIFYGGGFYDGDEWLSLELHDTMMVLDFLGIGDPTDESEELSKQVVVGLVEGLGTRSGGACFDSIEALLESIEGTDVSYL